MILNDATLDSFGNTSQGDDQLQRPREMFVLNIATHASRRRNSQPNWSQSITRLTYVLLLASSSSLAIDGTAIGNLAASMQPGEWAELSTSNLDQAIDDSGSESHILTYATDGKWNPGTKELFFIGGDHNGGPQKFISYSASTNTWTIEQRPPWMSSSVNQDHGYDYGAVDVTNQYYLYQLKRYHIPSGVWDILSSSGRPSFGRAHRAMEYFPDLQSYVTVGDGGLYLLPNGSSSWNTLLSQSTLNMAGLHPVAEYSPVHRVMLIGGGDGVSTLYKLDQSQKVTPIASAPFGAISCSPQGVILTVDPVGGNFLALTSSAEFWEYDVIGNSWRRLSGSVSPFSGKSRASKSNDAIGISINTYGVVMFVNWDFNNASKVMLYKHAPSSPAVQPKPPTGVIVQ